MFRNQEMFTCPQNTNSHISHNPALYKITVDINVIQASDNGKPTRTLKSTKKG